jgi:hypothetical protein
LGPQGVFFTTSPDFIHWSKPELAMTQDQMLRREPEGNWSYQYFSLIDPKSTDSSYVTITDSLYWYHVRMDDNHGPYHGVVSAEDQVGLVRSVAPEVRRAFGREQCPLKEWREPRSETDCARTVHESNVFHLFELSLSEKQIPRFVGNVGS